MIKTKENPKANCLFPLESFIIIDLYNVFIVLTTLFNNVEAFFLF